MKIIALCFIFVSSPVFLSAAPVPDDRVVLYDMKSDPSVAAFLNVKEIPGFFVMEIDELEGRAAIVYREGEDVFRSPADLKIKGNEITLKNKKNRRKWLKGTRTLPSGRTEEIIYSPDCPLEKDGWRAGPSYGRHLVRRKDDIGRKLVAVQADLEFKNRLERCSDVDADCGPPGCVDGKEALLAKSTAPALTNTASTPSKPSIKLSTAMIEATMNPDEILKGYTAEINSMLPSNLPGLTVASTGYFTRNIPYPYMANPTFEQQSKPMGVLFKTYHSTRTTELVRVEISPLPVEFQNTSLTRCGSSWDLNPMRTPFMVRSYSSLYIETPATGNTPAVSGLMVCGQRVSILIETQSAQTKEFMASLFDSFPLGTMEMTLGYGR